MDWVKRHPEVALQQLPQVDAVLHDQRLVEPVLLEERLPRVRGHVRARDRQRRVSGEEPEQQERHGHGEPDREHAPAEAAENEQKRDTRATSFQWLARG